MRLQPGFCTVLTVKTQAHSDIERKAFARSSPICNERVSRAAFILARLVPNMNFWSYFLYLREQSNSRRFPLFR